MRTIYIKSYLRWLYIYNLQQSESHTLKLWHVLNICVCVYIYIYIYIWVSVCFKNMKPYVLSCFAVIFFSFVFTNILKHLLGQEWTTQQYGWMPKIYSIILNERSFTQKSTYCMSPLIWWSIADKAYLPWKKIRKVALAEWGR